jgi:hypothetical protein
MGARIPVRAILAFIFMSRVERSTAEVSASMVVGAL